VAVWVASTVCVVVAAMDVVSVADGSVFDILPVGKVIVSECVGRVRLTETVASAEGRERVAVIDTVSVSVALGMEYVAVTVSVSVGRDTENDGDLVGRV